MKTLLLFLAGLVSFVSFAQDGILDTSFGIDGVVITDLENDQDFGSAIVEQADQKLVVAGSTNIGGDFFPLLLRYMPNGTLDTTFGTDGKVIATFLENSSGFGFLLLTDDQKLLSAINTFEGGTETFIITRYSDTGILDSTFGINGIVSIPDIVVSKMMLLADGSVLLFSKTSSEVTFTHYFADGSLDLNFGIDGYATSAFSGGFFSTRGLKRDSQNNLYILATRDNNASSDVILMKFLPNGYFDTSFGIDGVVIKTFTAQNQFDNISAGFDFTNDEKVVIAGSYGGCIDIGEPALQTYFLRYLNNGMPDNSFGNNGTVLNPVSSFHISQLIVQDNQRLLVSGSIPDCFEASWAISKRYFSGGTVDSSFSSLPLEMFNAETILQADGKIVTLGYSYWFNGPEDIMMARFNNNPLSVHEFETNKLIIYPNPSNGIFTIEREFSEMDNYQITDITGKIIANGELNDTQSQIDLSAAQTGVYFLKTGNSVFRLLKN